MLLSSVAEVPPLCLKPPSVIPCDEVVILLDPMSSVGKNIPHDSARGHVTGESIYVDDMPPARGELIVDFVWSPVAHGRIRGIDFEPARAVPGVVALFTHRDL